MKKLIVSMMLSLAATFAFAGGAGWESDFAKAAERAKKENKPMLLDFTGSDWCGWCIKLDKEVFSKKAFKDYAESSLVLVEVDFPQGKKQSAKEKKQNEELQQKYGVSGYPTIILLSSDGQKVLGKTGYRSGGPDAYVKHLKEIIGSGAK